MKNSLIWFTADTHFGSSRTLTLSRRPFSTVADMDSTLVENWNSVVKSSDVVYHLGDFGDPNFIFSLNGSKIYLIPGNYDTLDVREELKKDDRVTILPSYSTFTACGIDIHMVHDPIKRVDPNIFYLFGHIHRLQMVKHNSLNVGVDCHFFKPINLSMVDFYRDAINFHFNESVFDDFNCVRRKNE